MHRGTRACKGGRVPVEARRIAIAESRKVPEFTRIDITPRGIVHLGELVNHLDTNDNKIWLGGHTWLGHAVLELVWMRTYTAQCKPVYEALQAIPDKARLLWVEQ